VLASKTVEESVAHKPLKRLFLELISTTRNKPEILTTGHAGISLFLLG
jgi:hypothetical protein